MTGIIIVDIQGDFTQLMNGPLAVPGTNLDYIHKLQKEIDRLKGLGYLLWASQDWHPADHISFVTNHPGKKIFDRISVSGREQILWPPHCLQDTSGAELLMDTTGFEGVIRKGQDPGYDSYSVFQDEGGQETELLTLLKEKGIRKLVLFGIATDYCVLATALDARKRRFETMVVTGFCRGVSQETTEKALREMQISGVVLVENLDSLLGQ